MNQSKVAVRYAKAYYETCVEQNCIESGRNDLEVISNAIETILEFRLFLNDPISKPSEKISVIESLLKGKVSDLTINFVKLVITNKRETDLSSIIRNFISRYKSDKGYAEVSLTSAYKLDELFVGQIMQAVESTYNLKAQFDFSIDSDLIGGFILRVDDIQFDSSVATKLKTIKNILLN